MLHVDNNEVKEKLFCGNIGLEKESLRITPDGYIAQTPHPFPGDPYIVRDYSESQTEINTPVAPDAETALGYVQYHTDRILEKLSEQPQKEFLWPFSNPPYIRDSDDIPIAVYFGDEAWKMEYRRYLAGRYGKYMMTFCGIHFNYSFDEALLKSDYEAAGGEKTGKNFNEYKSDFYVSLSAKALLYNWLIVAVTAASPLLDSSYVEKGVIGQDVFNGMGTTRCSELGYWNFFTPVLDYSGIEAYADSILAYIDAGLIKSPAELYFPVRVKPSGGYELAALKDKGVSHIEMRMIDLNPLTPAGMDLRDVKFIQLLLIYLAMLPDVPMPASDQIQAVQNTKMAAHYDLKTVMVMLPDGESMDAASGALRILGQMRDLFRKILSGEPNDGAAPESGTNSEHPGKAYTLDEVEEILSFQEAKFTDAENRYAWQLRKLYANGFVEKGLELARERAK